MSPSFLSCLQMPVVFYQSVICGLCFFDEVRKCWKFYKLSLLSCCWAILQSNRMFFWWELCKLPPEHWYFGWQFETSKLQPARASCSVHLVPRDRTRWDFPKCFKCYFNTLKTGLRVFAWMSHWATTKISSIAWEKPYGFWRRLRPANRNIIKRSFFANIYQCWRELQFTCLPAKLLGTLRLVDQTFTDEFTWR